MHCSGAFAALLAEQWPAAVVASRGVRPIKGKVRYGGRRPVAERLRLSYVDFIVGCHQRP